MLSNEDLENIEYRYLETISHALKSSVNSVVNGLKSMNKIKNYWSNIHKKGDGFDTGFERIIYSALQSNTNDLGKPNSCLVGADLFFESPVPNMGGSLVYNGLANRQEFKPEVGRIVLFPGWLQHGIMTNSTDDTRISLSFNVIFDRMENNYG